MPQVDGEEAWEFKPGHLTCVSVEVAAGAEAVPRATLTLGPTAMRDAPYANSTTITATLPQNQPKWIESAFLLPQRFLAENDVGRARTVPLPLRLSTEAGPVERTLSLKAMPHHQFHLVVLSRQSERFRYWERLPACDSFTRVVNDASESRFYRVRTPKADSPPPLPANPLGWTSIGAIVWDDYPVENLSTPQRSALLDWLHWGGRLIVSGPDSLPALRTSFLADYLPADARGTETLPDALVADLRKQWKATNVTDDAARPWTIDLLEPRPGARTTATVRDPRGKSLPWTIERRIGRGYLIVTAFRLRQPEFRMWLTNDDGFLNSALLRHDPRRFRADREKIETDFVWAGGQPAIDPSGFPHSFYLARDTEAEAFRPEYLKQGLPAEDETLAAVVEDPPPASPPLASWDDYNGPADVARKMLAAASGVHVPGRGKLLSFLLPYVLAVVPGVWGLCRLLGKPEWTLWALPPLTVVACMVVWNLVQPTLGLERPRTHFQILEMHAGHPRAHLTRYVSIYAPLSAGHAVTLTNPTAIAAPLPNRSRPDLWLGREPFVCDLDRGVRIPDFQVRSNSLGILHTEEIYDLAGTVRIEPPAGAPLPDPQATSEPTGWTVVNDTVRTLRDAMLWCDGSAADARLVYPLGDIPPQGTALIHSDKVIRMSKTPAMEPEPESPPTIAGGISGARQRTLSLAGLVGQAGGNWRLVAWSDEEIGGVDVVPDSAGQRHFNLFVVQLRQPERPIGPDPSPRAKAMQDAGLNEQLEEGRRMLSTEP